MTSAPVIVTAQATVAEALARLRRKELTPALGAAVFVCRPPLETPTGRYLGYVHLQRLLREPPGTPVSSLIDEAIDAVPPGSHLSAVTRRLAAYNLVSLPVTDTGGRLIGAITVDDVLDHLLPDDWRDLDDEEDDDHEDKPDDGFDDHPGGGLHGHI
jgi:Mg/Co/Ni transporter MgtE